MGTESFPKGHDKWYGATACYAGPGGSKSSFLICLKPTMVDDKWGFLSERQKYMINRLRLRPLYEGDNYLCYSSSDEKEEVEAISCNVGEPTSHAHDAAQAKQAPSSGADCKEDRVNLSVIADAANPTDAATRKCTRRRLILEYSPRDFVLSSDNVLATAPTDPTPAKKKPRPRTKMVLLKRPRARSKLSRLKTATEQTRPSPKAAVTHEGYVKASWPTSVKRLHELYNPAAVRFEFEAPFVDECGCEDLCLQSKCRNGVLGIFCTASSCSFNGLCSNALRDHSSLRLVKNSVDSSYAVVADAYVEEGVIIGEYLGQLVVRSREQRHSRNNGYYLKINRTSQSHPRSDVFIDASTYGGITRFLNHSCAPSANFHEVRNGEKHTVVVVTSIEVHPGQEVTVNYGPNLWFVCRCGEPTCVHRDVQHLPDP